MEYGNNYMSANNYWEIIKFFENMNVFNRNKVSCKLILFIANFNFIVIAKKVLKPMISHREKQIWTDHQISEIVTPFLLQMQ